MSIIARLSQEIPKRKATGTHNPQYQATLQFVGEIEEAKERGYTWHQIGAAVKEELIDMGIWRDSWRTWNTEKFFRQIKKEKEGIA